MRRKNSFAGGFNSPPPHRGKGNVLPCFLWGGVLLAGSQFIHSGLCVKGWTILIGIEDLIKIRCYFLKYTQHLRVKMVGV